MNSILVQRGTWLLSRWAVYLLLQALGLPALAWASLGWTACEAVRWDHEQLLTFYRKLLPVARARLEKLDVLEQLFVEGWSLAPPRSPVVRNTREEVAQKLKLLRMMTDGGKH